MKYRIFLSLLFLSLFWILPAIAQADIIPLSGSAWSNMDNPATPLIDESTIGWINFNNEHCAVNPAECTCLSKGGVACPNSTYACNDGCAVGLGTYKVTVDSDSGMFSGYAWSENIGWIWFAPTDIPPGEAAANPAKLNLSTPYEVSGWARACAGAAIAGQPNLCTGTGDGSDADTDDDDGWDGWIKLRGTATNGSPYGVSLDTSPVPPAPAEFRGYAWGNDVVGWISFNCSNTGICGTSNYKVTTGFALNQPPSANNLSETLNYCAWGILPQVALGVSVTLNWTFSDPNPIDTQTAYEVWIDDDSSFTGPKFNYLVDPSSSTAYSLNLGNDQEGDWRASLDWGTTYYWKVKVRDNNGSWSTNWSSVRNFTLHDHASPNVKINDPVPPSPSKDEIATFTESSVNVYDDGVHPPTYWWEFLPDGDPLNSNQQIATAQFPTTTPPPKTINLTVTDSDGFSCTGSKTLNIQLPLPEWKEIPPFSWANKFLAMVTNLFKNL